MTTAGRVRIIVSAGLLAAGLASARATLPPPHASGADLSRLQVLMVNGGGSKSQNYQSHLLHLRGLHDVLRRAGIPRQAIALHVSDGDDPEPDVALRDSQPEPDFWLLGGTRLEAPLRTPITYANSEVPGAVLAPATRAELTRWFTITGPTLRAGDTLLLYVTDHGTRGTDDPANTAITLWGDNERLTVRDLADLLNRLDPGVRVVALMSQCFSGGFAGLARARSSGPLPDGSTCGYFSSTADRPAYGCYPENRGRDNVGHSFHFIDALAESGRFRDAHDEVLVRDATPDVPLRTTDVFLADLLREAAGAAGEDPTAFTDGLLRHAWAHPEGWERELRLIDRIANAYGFAGPRTIAELEREAGGVPDLAGQLRKQHTAWDAALESAARANLNRFLDARPDWDERLDDKAVRALPPESARVLTAELLADLGPATRAEREIGPRLELLRSRAAASREVAYRMDTRAGVVLRLRALLTTVAGRIHLARDGSAAERAAYHALRDCEDLAIDPVPLPEELQLARAEAFPPLADDLEIAAGVTPAWMGIQFRQAPDATRATAKLEPGAASVMAVYTGSPAEAAGLRVGDVVLGPPSRHFTERDQIREWTMLAAVDRPAALDVLRDGSRIGITLTPKPFPREWPALPGPPKVGSAAPPLRLGAYRGTPPASLAGGRPHLLFFWATWCGVCKSALPEIAAFERERGTRVVAITDEDRGRLDAFFSRHDGPFPALVATDESRRGFSAYGVSGMPTFVLVDGDGVVRAHATGYSAARGLALDGWAWTERAAQAD